MIGCCCYWKKNRISCLLKSCSVTGCNNLLTAAAAYMNSSGPSDMMGWLRWHVDKSKASVCCRLVRVAIVIVSSRSSFLFLLLLDWRPSSWCWLQVILYILFVRLPFVLALGSYPVSYPSGLSLGLTLGLTYPWSYPWSILCLIIISLTPRRSLRLDLCWWDLDLGLWLLSNLFQRLSHKQQQQLHQTTSHKQHNYFYIIEPCPS